MTSTTIARSTELFAQQRDSLNRNTDRLFGILMPIQFVGAILWAVLATPLTWAGTHSGLHPHVIAALVIGGLITLPICALTFWAPGNPINRYLVAVGQMVMSGLLIHISGGRIETHFHIFGSLAFLAFYRDWRILIPATLLVALDHIFRGIYLPHSIYGTYLNSNWRFLEHAGWVLFEDAVLVAAILRGVGEMRAIADRQALLEETNANIEVTVQERTKELRESEERFRAFSEQAVDAFFLFDEQGNILTVNEQASRSLGFDRETLQTMSVSDIEFGEVRSIESGLLNIDAEPVTIEGSLLRQDGTSFPVEVRAGVLPLAGKRHVLALARDATERKKVEAVQRAKEEAEASNKAKSHFLSRMSHELRTPLNAVLGFAQLLDTKEPSPRQQEFVSYILKGGNHLLKLIDEVLEISRIEVGSLSLACERVTVSDVLKEAVNLVTPLAQERAIQVELTISDGKPILVQADRQRLYQVAINILTNAIKYNHDGGSVTVCAEATETSNIRLIFADTGIGISDEMKARVFTPFDRLGVEKSITAEGTGLGLSLSKNLVEAMGGTLSFESTLGVGTTFIVELKGAIAEVVRPDADLAA